MSGRREKIKKLFQSKELEQTKHYSKKVSVLVLVLAAILLAILTVVGIFVIKYGFSDTDAFAKLVEENYPLSVIIIIAVCALQVMVALIPGELVELASGYAFGALGGAIYCLIGITLGSIIVIFLTRKLGRGFVESLCPREKIDSVSWISDPKKLNFLVALVFFIPGTPKDLFTYAIGLTSMSIPTYILITTIARIPSIIISTLSGDALGSSNLKNAIIFFIISAVTGVAGYIVYSLISSKRKKTNGDSNKINK